MLIWFLNASQNIHPIPTHGEGYPIHSFTNTFNNCLHRSPSAPCPNIITPTYDWKLASVHLDSQYAKIDIVYSISHDVNLTIETIRLWNVVAYVMSKWHKTCLCNIYLWNRTTITIICHLKMSKSKKLIS